MSDEKISGKILQRIRKERYPNLQDLVHALGATPSLRTLREWEKRGLPRQVVDLKRVARALGTTVGEILGESIDAETQSLATENRRLNAAIDLFRSKLSDAQIARIEGDGG